MNRLRPSPTLRPLGLASGRSGLSKRRSRHPALVLVLSLLLPAAAARAQSTNYPVDLPTVLRLAGARSLDVQLARERLNEAQANRQAALEQFFPWITAGVGYHRRDGVAQAVPSGIISDAHFQSYSPGGTLAAQVNLGDALYNSLAAKQLLAASNQALESQRQQSLLDAAQGYFELARTHMLSAVLRQALETSRDYQQQLHSAVGAGIAFKGDELRVESQTRRYQLELEQSVEHQHLASTELARILHLDPQIELVPQDSDLSPLILFEPKASKTLLVDQGLRVRPELKEQRALSGAARAAHSGAAYGPLFPSIGAQAFGGGLGGGPDGGPSTLGAEGDYSVGVAWRIGPGGLFDSARLKETKARLAGAELAEDKLKDAIVAEVVAGLARVESLDAQLGLAKTNLTVAEETLRLTRQRKQYGVGLVLEDIQAQQALTDARSAYCTVLAEHNKAQYALSRAVGGLGEPK